MLEQLTAWLTGEGGDDLVPSHFGFGAPLALVWCLLLLVAAGAGIAVYYWWRLSGVDGRTRVFLVVLRTMVVVLALFLALDPSIIAQRIKPGEQFVILLFDDSQSMRLVGQDGLSRGERLLVAYEKAGADFESRLSRKHQLARHRLGVTIEPLERMVDLDFSQRESDLSGGILSALTDMEGTNVSAVVLFSDGVQQSENAPVAIEDLPVSTPIFTVGVDTESNWHDIELTSLSMKRSDFDQSPLVLDVGVRSSGLAGREAEVQVFLGGRMIKSRRIEIGEDLDEHRVRIEFVPDRPGWIEYEARVHLVERTLSPLGEDARFSEAIDHIKENNSRRFAVDNREKVYRILYVSGRPNWENKFVRRTLEANAELGLEADKQLKLTSLICISNAERKFVFRGKRSTLTNPLFEGFDDDQDRPRYDEAVFLRIGAGENELVSGYPTDPEELFDYSLVIWGDVEREFFTTAQLELTRDFVEKRGGSLLLLGGPNSFTNGRYTGTLIESMLPVVLYETHEDAETLRSARPFRVVPTVEGSLAGAWSLDTKLAENRALWEEMPDLFGLDKFALVRPGATVMALATSKDSALDGLPLFAVQRYGEGKCAVLATSDTWQWQMQVEAKDARHERLWRQILRNLVHETPDPAVLRAKKDAYAQGVPAEFEFIVRDGRFDKREGLRTTVVLTTPSGQELLLPVEESIQEAGLYSTSFAPEETGLHRLALKALDDNDETVETLEEAFLVEPDRREFQNAEFNPGFLRDLSQATGGNFYSLDGLDELAGAIPVPLRRDAEELWIHLWHLPVFYLVLVAMMATEWYVRRRKGRP